MPLQNRVTPLGDLVATPARGLVYGNRGCLHDAGGRIRRRYAGRRWIACRLQFRGWHREPLMQPGRYTELFFLDEATAFAAGHRPCALCRREDYDHFATIWRTLHPGQAGAGAIDAQLHGERLAERPQAATDDLPDGAFVLRAGEPWVVRGGELLRWTAAGYADRTARPAGEQARLITPPSLVAVLRAGWEPVVPLLHPSAEPESGPSFAPAAKEPVTDRMRNADDMLAVAASSADRLAAPGLSPRPRRKVAVLACMDTRIDLFPLLGLERGDAHIIRNAGGLVTDDAIRSLSASQRLLGTEEIVVIMHDGCGLQGASEDEFAEALAGDGVLPTWRLGAFDDVEATLRHSLARLRASRELPARDHIRGLVFDPETGTLREVVTG
jgi:carbonic anhydrase